MPPRPDEIWLADLGLAEQAGQSAYEVPLPELGFLNAASWQTEMALRASAEDVGTATRRGLLAIACSQSILRCEAKRCRGVGDGSSKASEG
jgi:hypothetical protein